LRLCAEGWINPTYRKPFDLMFERVNTTEWRALGDDFGTLTLAVAQNFDQGRVSGRSSSENLVPSFSYSASETQQRL
jgi:hypothetical protein